MSMIPLNEYIGLLENNAARCLKEGSIEIIMMWLSTCGHCKAQFKYFMRPLSHQPGNEGMGMDLVEYERLVAMRTTLGDNAWEQYKEDGGTLTKAALDNIEMVACRIIPVEMTSEVGKELIIEAKTFADKLRTINATTLKNPRDYEIRYTPAWIDFHTHENYGYGHHSERQLRDMLSKTNLPGRRKRFKTIHSQVIDGCDAIACGLPTKVNKIDPKKSSHR